MIKEFRKDDYVVYGKNGVCLIEDIRSMNFVGEDAMYYILKPRSSNSSTVYIPVENHNLVSKMRAVMTKKQIDEMLSTANDEEIEWNDAKNERLEEFNSIMCSGNSRSLLLLVKCIYRKKLEKEAAGKHLSATDENILRDAEELIEEEFSFALNCSADKVPQYIEKHIK